MVLQFAGIYLVSFILNYGVQLSYYFWKKGTFAGQRTLLNYYTGYLGDGIIVPVINIFIYYIIVNTGIPKNILPFVFLALILDFFTHYLQGKLKLINWSMPKPFKWNFAGYWHMVSFPIQISYLLMFFYIVFSRWNTILTQSSLVAATAGVFSLGILFLMLFAKDTH